MGKKLTYEFVKEQFEKEGYELLSKEYINANTKLDYICPEGHSHSISWNYWWQGARCAECFGTKRHTIEFIRSEFEKEGYKLLSTYYNSNKQKLRCYCDNNHEIITSWNKWQSGYRCGICAGNVKLDIEFIRAEFEKEGYTLLTEKYTNSAQKLEFICPHGHTHSIRWNNWQQGQSCAICAVKNRSSMQKYSIEFISSEFKNEGYELLTKDYIDNQQKLDYICSEGHRHNISWNSWQSGCRCFYCNGKEKLTLEFINKEFEKEGYILLSKNYINSKQKLRYVCSNGHIGNIRWNDWASGHRCYKCSMRIPSIDDIRKEFEDVGYKLISAVYINSGTKLRCICSYGHEYSVSLGHWRKGIRCNTCAIINRSGPNSSAWKGGISFEPYCSAWKDKEYKNSIKERDIYKCQNPNCNSKNPNDLTIHHIDYDKKNCNPNNLITLCRSCNTKANIYRHQHKEFYQSIMNKKYNYNF